MFRRGFGWFEEISNGVLDLIYPPICLSCDQLLKKGERTVCRYCCEQLQLINPEERCQHCFAPAADLLCRECHRHRTPLQIASAFVYEGVAANLVKNLKFANRTDLAPSLASFLAVQVERLGWEPADYLVPVPMYWMRQVQRGYNQSTLIAQELQRLWGGEVRNALKRRGGEGRQGGLDRKQRKHLTSSSFLGREGAVRDRTVCLIDDVATTGSTLTACAEALLCAGAKSVRALAVCRAGV